jgi:hypothetical protein
MRQSEAPLSPTRAALPACGSKPDFLNEQPNKKAPRGAFFHSASRTRKKEAKRGKPEGVRSR